METTATLKRRAEQGDTEAQFRLGLRFACGRLRPRPTDWETVVRYWRAAADAGHLRAQFYLATCYDQGNGVPQDTAEAMRWYRRAAEGGQLDAQYKSGIRLPRRRGRAAGLRTDAPLDDPCRRSGD